MIAKLDSLFARISDNRIIKAIRQGLLYNLPLIMVGAFTLTVLNLPLAFFSDTLNLLFGNHWRTLGQSIHSATFGIMSLTTLISISYALAQDDSRLKQNQGTLNTVMVITTALASYIAFNPATESALDPSASGPTGMFGAIVIAVASSYLYMFFCSLKPKSKRLYAYDGDAILLLAINNVLPALYTIGTFAFVKLIFEISGFSAFCAQSLNGLMNFLFHSGNNLLTVVLYSFLAHIMWFFGIHGTNVLEPVSQQLFLTATHTNTALVSAGLAPTEVITKEFLDNFVFLGGAGCTLGLLIALFLTGRNSNSNGLAKYSVAPGLFNMNELLVYGLPIIFNPYYLIPFLFTPVILCISSYIAFSTGLVALTTQQVVWTTPIFLSGYVSTGSFSGVILQLFNLCLAAALYLPFIRLYEKQITRNNRAIFKRVSDEYNNAQPGENPFLMARNDEMGMVARALATELRKLSTDEPVVGLHLEFQPKTLSNGTVYGAEALLRWNHTTYGYISPLVTIGIAEEADLTVPLGKWILQNSFEQLAQWTKLGYPITLSVNLSPKQLKEDTSLVDTVLDIIKKYDLNPKQMELELTEHAALDQSLSTRNRLEQLKNTGLSISIDDFGMGNSSILYLRDFYANVVKLDMSLVRTIETNVQNQEIVRSVVSLCTQLDAGVVAEGVETEGQVQALEALGCNHFQGWYFSKSLPNDTFIGYLKRKNKLDE